MDEDTAAAHFLKEDAIDGIVQKARIVPGHIVVQIEYGSETNVDNASGSSHQ